MSIILNFLWILSILMISYPVWLPKALKYLLRKKEFFVDIPSHFTIKALSFMHQMSKSSTVLVRHYLFFKGIKLRWLKSKKK